MIDFLFKNIGKLIQEIAYVMIRYGTIVSLVAGIILIVLGFYTNDDTFFYIGIPELILGPIITALNALFVYAFGQMVEDTHTIALTNQPTPDSTCNTYTNSNTKTNKSDSSESRKSEQPRITNHATQVIAVKRGLFEYECPECKCVQPNTNEACENCGKIFVK